MSIIDYNSHDALACLLTAAALVVLLGLGARVHRRRTQPTITLKVLLGLVCLVQVGAFVGAVVFGLLSLWTVFR